MKKYAVIVAGGTGVRMGGAVPKQFLPVHGRPVLWHTLRAFLEAYEDLTIILVLPDDYIGRGREIAELGFPGIGDAEAPGVPGVSDVSDVSGVSGAKASGRICFVTGGATRFHSVKNGLELVPENSIVFVHDGVRCLVSVELIRACFVKALGTGNAIPAIACIDSVRMETAEGSVVVDRSLLRIVQTPQTFDGKTLKEAFRQPYDPSFTDEAGVVERMGVKIHLVEGEATNIKITKPVDLVIAEKILEEREA